MDDLIEAAAKGLYERRESWLTLQRDPWEIVVKRVRVAYLAEAEAALSALEGAGFRVFRPDDAPRKWWCDEDWAYFDSAPVECTEAYYAEDHEGCGWVRIVKEDN